MTRLIRWGHLVDGRVVVLWTDGETPRRTVIDGITAESIEGEPLPDNVVDKVWRDEHLMSTGRKPLRYAGVIQPATEAMC